MSSIDTDLKLFIKFCILPFYLIYFALKFIISVPYWIYLRLRNERADANYVRMVYGSRETNLPTPTYNQNDDVVYTEELIKKGRELLRTNPFPSDEDIFDKFIDYLQAAYEEYNLPVPSPVVLKPLNALVQQLIAAEKFNVFPAPPSNASALELAQYRDSLSGFFRLHENPAQILSTFNDTVGAVWIAFCNRLPDIFFHDSPNETPFAIPLTAIGNMTEPIESIFKHFTDETLAASPLFIPIRRTLEANRKRITDNLPPTKKHLSAPADFAGTPKQAISAYLGGTPFKALFDLTVPFNIPDETRFAGMWCVAPSGTGKSTLLRQMILEDLKKDAAVILMDSTGGITETFRNLKSIADRLVIIDPDPDHPIALNPLDIPKTDANLAIDQLEYLFSSLLETKLTANQSVLFRNLFRLLSIVPDATLDTFRTLLTTSYKDYPEEIKQRVKQLPQRTQDFFSKEFDTKQYSDRRLEVVARLPPKQNSGLGKQWIRARSSSSTIRCSCWETRVLNSSGASSSLRSSPLPNNV
jgi:hypothetical protein